MRRPITLPATLLTVLALAAAGCGGSSSGGGSSGGSATPSGTAPKELFANACGSCHTLGAAETSGAFGPNLDDLQPTEQEVATAIADGPGPMPAGLIKNDADADAVAKYVADSAGS